MAVLFNISVDPDDTDPDSMLVYPRFCMVKKDDHKHAAFYPPLTRKRHQEEEFSREIISEFVKDYLANPKKLLEDTDQFWSYNFADITEYSKTCLERPLKKNTKNWFSRRITT